MMRKHETDVSISHSSPPSPRGRRHAGPAGARLPHSAWLAAAGRAPIRRMVCICTPLGVHPPYFFPEQGRQGLPAHALPGAARRPPRRLHRDLRTGASGRGLQPRFHLQLPDRRPASGKPGRLPQQHLARPVRGRAYRRRRRASPACRCRPKASACRGRAAAPCAVGSFPGSVFARLVPGGSSRRGAGPGTTPARRPEHPRHGPRPGQEDAARPGHPRPRQGRRILHQRPRAGAAAWLTAEQWSKKPKPKVDAKPPQEHHQLGRPHRQDPAHVRPHPSGVADRLDPAHHDAPARAPAACRRSRACRWAITTCRTTARIPRRSSSSRRSSWKR